MLRTKLSGNEPAKLWEYYLQLTEIEQAFKELEGDLAIRPIHNQLENRIESLIFIPFLAYCLQVTLKARLKGQQGELRANDPRKVMIAAVLWMKTTSSRTGWSKAHK